MKTEIYFSSGWAYIDLKNAEADIVGEALRSWAFVKEYGCYSCFDLIPGFEEVPASLELLGKLLGREPDNYEIEDILPKMTVGCHKDADVLVMWFWDGDGWLYFDAPKLGVTVENTDCKCSYGWRFVQ